MTATTTIALIGYGNPGRLDDGLGPAVAAHFEKRGLPGVTVDADYQLTVEDAETVSRHDVVVFVDADVAGPEPFWFGPVEPREEMSFSSHSLSANAVLHMANAVLGGKARGYMLGIRGYEFDAFGERLSPGAQRNLDAAVDFLERALVEKAFDEYAARYDNCSRSGDCAGVGERR